MPFENIKFQTNRSDGFSSVYELEHPGMKSSYYIGIHTIINVLCTIHSTIIIPNLTVSISGSHGAIDKYPDSEKSSS